jgi:glycosyltransferase involved in cell wall biosynthesis
MVQVLHLMSTEPDLQTERTASLIRRAAGQAAEIVTRGIGRGGVYRNVAHAAMSLRFGRGVPFDVIHAFDSPSLLAACAAPSPLLFSPSEIPAAASPWWRAAMVYRNGTAIANSLAMERHLIRRGVPASRCDVVGPAIDLALLSEKPDEELRSRLDITSEDRVMLAPGESTRVAGHLLALHTTSILHVLDERCRLLIWGRGPSVKRLERLARLLRQPRLLIAAESKLGHRIDFERLVPLADLALVASPAAPPMPVAMCMAAGLPIVSAAAPAITELLEDGRTASLVPKFAPRLLAQRLLHAMENPDEAKAWGIAAQADAAVRFDPRRTAGRFIGLYKRIAGISPKGEVGQRVWEAVLSK